MVSIRNIMKFLDDHPDVDAERQAQILEQACASAEGVILTGLVAGRIMGDLANVFFREVTNNPDHVQMGLTDIAEQFGRKPVVDPTP